MPFTLAHPAAILPIARDRLVASALVLGSMAPDLTYYVSLPWIDPTHTLLTRTHHWPSVLWLDPLIALVLLAVFHLLLKRPLVALLPRAAAERVWPFSERFVWQRAPAVGWIILSVAIGAATHVAWDDVGELFGDTWSPKVDLVGTVVGLAVILGWTRNWWRATGPQPIPAAFRLPVWLRTVVLGLLVAMPLLMGIAGAVRSVQGFRSDNRVDGTSWSTTDLADLALRVFAEDAVKTAVVLVAVYAIGWQVNRLVGGRRGSGSDRADGVQDHGHDLSGAGGSNTV